jgi:hypothetical protein
MTVRLRLLALAASALLLAPSCTGTPAAAPTPAASTPTTTSPTPTASPTPVAVAFDVDRTMGYLRRLAVTIGIREAGSTNYTRAANYVAVTLEGFGYSVMRQTVPLPAGKSQGVAVPAGDTENLIAAPRGYDPAKPHLVVGAHLDTVAVTRGANDNGSGSAVLLELARLASLERTTMPIVWIAFGGEERRNPGVPGATFGSRYYLGHLSKAERAAIRGMVSVDMVGAGPTAFVCHESITGDALVDAMVAAGKRLKLPVQKRVVAGYFSDHSPFEHAGFLVAWLWSGEHATLHKPSDTIEIVQPASIDRIGRTAWETLRTVRL